MIDLRLGDCRDILPTLPAHSCQCCVTSPPYWRMRDYGHADQIGMEDDPFSYLTALVGVFAEIKRIMRPSGVLFVNIGDTYYGDSPVRKTGRERFDQQWDKTQTRSRGGTRRSAARCGPIKPKDLTGIPWRLALALQEQGWWLRSDLIWHKPDAPKEPVTDRPYRAHEYLFMLTKSRQYSANFSRLETTLFPLERMGSVWSVETEKQNAISSAPFPLALIAPCILVASSEGDTVIDPFAGSGTTALAADRLGRSFLGIELVPDVHALALDRLRTQQTTFL